MLKLLSSWARIAFGFALACLAAGLVTVLFVNTPAEVLAEPVSRLPKTAGETLDLALLTATHASIFSAAFVLIAAGLGEWFSIRSMPFYLICGLVIAALGFAAQFYSEVAGQPTIMNNYAIKAFLTTGFVAGFVYWLAAGQFAGKAPDVAVQSAAGNALTPDQPAPAPEKVEVDARPRKSIPIRLHRLKDTPNKPSQNTKPID